MEKKNKKCKLILYLDKLPLKMNTVQSDFRVSQYSTIANVYILIKLKTYTTEIIKRFQFHAIINRYTNNIHQSSRSFTRHVNLIKPNRKTKTKFNHA